jgi:predicted nucleotidyltransferase component of viral defense system
MIDTSPVRTMLERYQCRNNDERRQALKEIVQEITLVALDRAGFFAKAAFYGGTALRIFHGLDRYSEDLDFSLLQPDTSFALGAYLKPVKDELGSYGLEMELEQKQKTTTAAVQSAFIKSGTLINLVKITSIKPPVPGVHENELLKIKLEVDTDPPAGAGYEVKYGLSPIPYSVRLYDLPSLFAGKIHALLCRNWKQRAKGRDFYDYLWYLSRNTPVNLSHLESRLKQSGHWPAGTVLDQPALLRLLAERFSTVDWAQAKADILPYIKDTRAVDLWGTEFFTAISGERLKISYLG